MAPPTWRLGGQVILDDVAAAVFVGGDENGGSSGREREIAMQKPADASRRQDEGRGRAMQGVSAQRRYKIKASGGRCQLQRSWTPRG